MNFAHVCFAWLRPPRAQQGSADLRLSSKLNDTKLRGFTFQRLRAEGCLGLSVAME